MIEETLFEAEEKMEKAVTVLRCWCERCGARRPVSCQVSGPTSVPIFSRRITGRLAPQRSHQQRSTVTAFSIFSSASKSVSSITSVSWF